MNEIQAFNNGLFGTVRATIINGQPWFVGADKVTPKGLSFLYDMLNGKELLVS